MIKWYCLVFLMFSLSLSVVSWADVENEAVDRIYLKYKLSEVRWDRDDISYGDEVLDFVRDLRDFNRDLTRDWAKLSEENRDRLAEMNLKMGDYFTHQRDPKRKSDGKTLDSSVIRYPALSLENLAHAELFYNRYLEMVQDFFHREDWENVDSVRAYYYRASARMILAEYCLERFEELGGSTLQEKQQTMRFLIERCDFSISDFQRVKLLMKVFGLQFSVDADLESAQYRFYEAVDLSRKLAEKP